MHGPWRLEGGGTHCPCIGDVSQIAGCHAGSPAQCRGYEVASFAADSTRLLSRQLGMGHAYQLRVPELRICKCMVQGQQGQEPLSASLVGDDRTRRLKAQGRFHG